MHKCIFLIKWEVYTDGAQGSVCTFLYLASSYCLTSFSLFTLSQILGNKIDIHWTVAVYKGEGLPSVFKVFNTLLLINMKLNVQIDITITVWNWSISERNKHASAF